MPSIKGIKCSLVVSKLPAQEYGTTIEGDFASTYVVAEAHEHFYLNVVTTEFVHRNLEIYVYIDGKYQNSSIWTELDASMLIDESYYGKRVRDNEDPEVAFERPWKFDALIEAEPDEEKSDEEMSNIGMIEVVVLRCNDLPTAHRRRGRPGPGTAGCLTRVLNDPAIAPHPCSKEYWKNWAAEEERNVDSPAAVVGAVNKKHIKEHNISSRVTAEGDEELVLSVVSDANLVFLDTFDKPYCILVMKYRSRSVLIGLDYIPMPPVSSRASSVAVDLDELNALSKEEMVKELIRYKKMVGKSLKRGNSADESEKLLKRFRVKKEAFVCSIDKVIDLTND